MAAAIRHRNARKYRVAIVLARAILGKIMHVHIAPRGSGATTDKPKTLGALMNTRALLELIVLNVAYEFDFPCRCRTSRCQC